MGSRTGGSIGTSTALALVVCLACSLSLTSAYGQDSGRASRIDRSDDIRSLVHVLDYVAQDYAGAVSEGRVIDTDEYDEMTGFGREATSLLSDLTDVGVLPHHAGLQDLAEQLTSGITAKASPDSISAHAQALRRRILDLTNLPTAPAQWPDLANARASFEATCAVCHGRNGAGDGRVAGNLNPRPTDFIHGDRITSQSPFQIYNTLRLGVEGTAMPDFQVLSEQELWKLAFFVKSLPYQADSTTTPVSDSIAANLANISLQQAAALNDDDLKDVFTSAGVAQPAIAIAAMRTSTREHGNSASLAHAKRLLGQVAVLYKNGDVDRARRAQLQAYLEGVEPVEPTLKVRDAALTAMLEKRMLAVRTGIEHRADPTTVTTAVREAIGSLDEAERVLVESPPSLLFSFFMAASILIREGLEAFLVILAILGVLRSLGQTRAIRWVHAGWMTALSLGVVAWFFSEALIQIGAAQRELMEGLTALLAVTVLLYVGFWLHSKSEIKKWKEFIELRVKRTLGTGNLFGLAAISFFAVFREAFESVLFLSALTLEQGAAHRAVVAGGAAMAIGVVLVLSALLLRYSGHLPTRRLFKYSSAAVGVLCIVLVGKGIHAFQEAGILSVTPAPFAFRFELFGMYATIETLASQSILLIIVLLLWHMPKYSALRTAVS